MNLEALLDELRTNLLRDDAGQASGPDDRLWSDATLVRYINVAQRRFARRTLILRDFSTPEVVEVPLATGDAEMSLHPSVVAVISCRYDTSATDLPRAGHGLLSGQQITDPPYFDTTTMTAWPPGAPRVFSTDEALDMEERELAVILRVWPEPAASQNGLLLHLRVARTPLVPFTLDDSQAEGELPEDYQLDSLSWAAYLALRTSDIDGHSLKADAHKVRFEEAVQEAKRDARLKLRAPTTWAFGRNGFAWSR